MNCSTFSNKTGIENDTNANIMEDDFVEKYDSLKKQLDYVTKCFETTKQELYETKRNYQTALDSQQHLTAELDSVQGNEVKIRNDWSSKFHVLQEELVALRDERTKISETHALQVKKMEIIIKDLTEKVNMKVEDKIEERKEDSTVEEFIKLKTENSKLHEVIAEHKVALQESTELIRNLQMELGDLKEELLCVKSNLSGKKDELATTTELLHCTQEELATLNMELQRVKTETSHAAKGNSLFAEVDDKRQEMARSLIQMKQQSIQLKRDVAEKQAQIDGLLCEKKTLWEEYTGLSSQQDAELFKCYEKRIRDLESTVEQQRQDTMRWFSKLQEPGSAQHSQWLGAILAHFKDRTSQLSDELAAASIECLAKGTQIRELHRQVASWRLNLVEANTQISQLQKNSQNIVSLEKTETAVSTVTSKREFERNIDVKKKVTF